MLDVKDRLIEQLGDVRVVQVVDDAFAASLADDKAKVAQLPELMGDGRGLHADGVGELADRAGPLFQAPEDLHAAGCGEDLHALGDQTGGLGVERCGLRGAFDSVTHPHA